MQTNANAVIRKLAAQVQSMQAEHKLLQKELIAIKKEALSRPRTITEEIDSIKGRRIFYNLSGRQSFTIANNGRRADPIQLLISQDGPFIATHYPLAVWKPNQPATATNFGRWRPVYSWPLPDQVLDTDIIELSYEVQDGGSQRSLQNEAAPPLLSRSDALHPLPCPTIWSPNSVISVFPVYEQISFDTAAAVPTTGGELAFLFPGYRIVNL